MTTIQTLPPALLEQLLQELSTLASVYHKPPEAFLGHGRFGAEAMQRAAIEEQKQLASERTISASAAADEVSGAAPAAAQNVENLLDIDFDAGNPGTGTGTPARVDSPPSVGGPSAPTQPANMHGLDDLLGGFGGSAAPPAKQADLAGGLAGLDLGTSAWATDAPPAKKSGDGNDLNLI